MAWVRSFQATANLPLALRASKTNQTSGLTYSWSNTPPPEIASMKKVLSVGQCVPDNGSIKRFLTGEFGVRYDTADLPADAMQKLRGGDYDLVLVNRKLDRDYSEGMDVVKAIKADDALKDVPVMLVTNFDEHQQVAVAAGALEGFGKDDIGTPQAVSKLKPILA